MWCRSDLAIRAPRILSHTNIFFRDAENRTRTSWSQTMYTTTILHPVITYLLYFKYWCGGVLGPHGPKPCILPIYYAPLFLQGLAMLAYFCQIWGRENFKKIRRILFVKNVDIV